ncbi:ComEA family DNA-binding protein [bacterium]|nr:ComEA family DNA-binding protein [bacterium]
MRKLLSIAWLLLVGLALPAGAESLLLESSIHVQVKGLVKRPGVYQLRLGARGADAIQAAGGLLPGAELSGLNLAAALKDGDALLVPKHGASAASNAPVAAKAPRTRRARAAAAGDASQVVNLNSATLAQLDALPGIGPAIAGDILAYRSKHGSFRSLDELREVPGIGERKLSRLRPFLRL